jgi:signal transduction histidine kinase/HAMP domain-containing protein
VEATLRRGGRLARKYVVILVSLVGGALLVSGAIEIYASYTENQAALVALQREKAFGAASRIESFVREIERQLVWTTQPLLVAPAAAIEQRRLDAARLQRQVLAITEVSHLDPQGREQLRVSRLAMNVVGSQLDFSAEPKFRVPKTGKTYFGPVYFRKESEPYMTIAMPQSGGGVTVAEVNLKFIWDVVSQIKVGKAGLAYVVDASGALIAHPDISLVLQKTSLAELAQVKGVLASLPGAEEVTIAKDLKGRDVLTAHSVIATLGWVVLVEQPLEEAFAPLRASAYRTMVLMALGILLAVVASVVLARRLARPIQALQTSAAKIGAGELDHRIAIRTGDELEALADEFNRMTGRLRESYATLEEKVENRTRELTEALEQQTTTADILRVISSSPTDLQPVMEALVESAARLCEAQNAQIFQTEDNLMRLVARHGPVRSTLEAGQARPLTRGSVSGRAIVDRAVLHVIDLLSETDREYPDIAPAIHRESIRTTIGVPLLRKGVPIGSITAFRTEVRPFTDTQIALLQTFADQAVIAIENVRLFTELQDKNRVVTEALDRQTATSEILRVISSSPTDLHPVFEAILASATRLCDAQFGMLFRYDGAAFESAAVRGDIPPVLAQVLRRVEHPGPQLGMGRLLRERRPVHIPDLTSETAYAERMPVRVATVEQAGIRTWLGVPMLKDQTVVGALVIYRHEVRPFSDKQIELVGTFASQAVIAIENVRLFQELEEKNRTITEALDQQTATGEILRAISSSPTDVQPVFDTIVRNAVRLCSAHAAAVFRLEGGLIHEPANHGGSPERLAATRARYPRPLDMESTPGIAILTRALHQFPDTEDPSTMDFVRETGRLLGVRSVVSVPLVRESEAVGAIVVTRREPGRFSEAEVELLRTFADQAVIAIENVRLFQELQARTADLTRSVGELRALSEVGQTLSATLDLPTVLTTIVTRAVELADTSAGMMFEYEEGEAAFRLRAAHNMDQQLIDFQNAEPVRLGEGAVGQAVQARRPVQVEDLQQAPLYTSRQQVRHRLLELGYRSVLAVPLLVEDRILGALVVFRRGAGGFASATVDLLRTFGTQSALAIQNARLFREIETKSRELEIANQHKDEFMASMSHELRTPLNAIIGFSEVMLERLFGDVNAKQEEYLNDILSSGRHLLSLINDILDLAKIEAGRMELEAADFDLPQAIDNALVLVRERALRREITLEQTVDPELGAIKGDERKIKQVLLNLLSNAVKFTPEGGRVEVRARRAGAAAEISVTDTGVGIAPEDHEAVFEEFRQVGTDYARKHEGTGLGLALARKFVELHGGTIRVDSHVGQGATFTFTIPVAAWQAS